MAKAVASGMPKLKIEEAAARRQARIDSGKGEGRGRREGEREGGREGGREREREGEERRGMDREGMKDMHNMCIISPPTWT